MPDLDIIGENSGSLSLTAADIRSMTEWPDQLIIDYLNLVEMMNRITQAINNDFGTMALQNADAVAITGGTISGVTLDDIFIGDVTATNVTTVNLTATGTVNLHDVTITGYTHATGFTDDATSVQVTITDSLVDISQDTSVGQIWTAPYAIFDTSTVTNDGLILNSAFTGIADNTVGTIVARVRVKGSNNRTILMGRNVGAGSNTVYLYFSNTTNLLNISCRNGASNRVFGVSSVAYTDDTEWLSICISFNTASSDPQMYVNDVSVLDAAASGNTAGTIPYTGATKWTVGIDYNDTADFAGDMEFVWANFTSATDFSVEANRRLYFDAAGFTVDLGPTGNLPTGSTPMLYVVGAPPEFITNLGTGGGFTLQGSITGGIDSIGRLHFTDSGYYTDNATDGDMGAETFNSLGYYQDGVYVPTISSTSILTNKTINIDDNTLTATGGAAGEIPIFNLTTNRFVNATITGSTGVSVTNADGSITLATTSANEATDTTCFPLFITASGTQTLQPKNNTSLTFNSSTGNLGASAVSVTGSTVPVNGMYLPAASTLGWAVNSAAELQLTATAFSPAADGGSSLGTTALGWQNIFGNTGFVLNIEGGNWVATHTSAVLTIGTGDLLITTAGTATTSVVNRTGAQTLTGKTISADSNTITSTAAAGTVLTSTGSGIAATFQSPAAAATVTIVDAAADPTTFVLLAGAATGNLPVLTDAGISYNALTNILTTTGGVTTVDLSLSNDLTFTGTGNRILADLSNATLANRTMLQTSTVDGASQLRIIPNGTGTTAGWQAGNSSDPANSSTIVMIVQAAAASLFSNINGAGVLLPLNIGVNSGAAISIDTSNNFTVGVNSASTLTINSGTWTLANNYTATRAVGAAPAGFTAFGAWNTTFSGDAGGTTDGRSQVHTTTVSGANSVSQVYVLQQALNLNATAGTVTNSVANTATLNSQNAGAVTLAQVYNGQITVTGAGSVTTGRIFTAGAPSLTSTGAITTLYGFVATNLGHATLITNSIGFQADNMTASVTLTASFRSQQNSGTGVWAFLSTGTASSALAGNVRIGSNVAPTVALDVTGAALISTTLGVTGVLTLTPAISMLSTGGGPTVGELTMVIGTKTVTTTAATATCKIFFQRKTAGGTIGFATTYTINAGVSFTVSSDSALDTSIYAWWIVESR